MSPQSDASQTIGIALALKVLSGEDQAMVDLRAQRGVSIGTPNELRQLFALKVYEGAEPDEIRLTDSEVLRARDSAHFFLVIVSGIEAGGAERMVRVIAQPLDQLHRRDDGGMRFDGVRSARSLVYRIATGDQK